MRTFIYWHKTSEELPKQKEVGAGKKKVLIDEPCLVIYEGRIKPSKYITEEQRWEGHMPFEVPDYWVKLNELRTTSWLKSIIK